MSNHCSLHPSMCLHKHLSYRCIMKNQWNWFHHIPWKISYHQAQSLIKEHFSSQKCSGKLFPEIYRIFPEKILGNLFPRDCLIIHLMQGSGYAINLIQLLCKVMELQPIMLYHKHLWSSYRLLLAIYIIMHHPIYQQHPSMCLHKHLSYRCIMQLWSNSCKLTAFV